MNLVRLSKFMSLILRHRARDFGLAPDPEGFVPLDALLAVLQTRSDPQITRAYILAVVASSEPKRFEGSGERGIRATYGHSRKNVAAVNYAAVEPPPVLYHGTRSSALNEIRRRGLKPMQRQYVHLSTTVERARRVASRRTHQPVILVIRAEAAARSGIVFHSPEPHHYLVRELAPDFIVFPENKEATS